MKRVSVIVPARDSELTIERCVASALTQDWPGQELEVIVVDNGSKDGTAAAARRSGARVVTESKAGRSAARNRGAREATGDFFAFLDADSTAPVDWLRKCTEVLRQPWIGASQPLVQKQGRANKTATARFVQAHYYLPFLSTCGLVTTRTAFEAARGFDEELARAVDIDFSFRLLATGFALAWQPRTTVVASHDLNHRQALRRGWVRGEATARLSKKWHWLENASDGQRRLDWLKIWARVTLSDLRAPISTRGLNATEELTKVVASFVTDLKGGDVVPAAFEPKTPLSAILGPRRYLLLTPDGAELFDQARRQIVSLTEDETLILECLVGDARGDEATLPGRLQSGFEESNVLAKAIATLQGKTGIEPAAGTKLFALAHR